jgi:hypothetical protein
MSQSRARRRLLPGYKYVIVEPDRERRGVDESPDELATSLQHFPRRAPEAGCSRDLGRVAAGRAVIFSPEIFSLSVSYDAGQFNRII